MISTVLFDADGVIQTTGPDWRQAWAELIDNPERLDDFLADIFAMEYPFLSGGDGFYSALDAVLRKWNSSHSTEAALNIWTQITPVHEILDITQHIRQPDRRVCLATNQQVHRFNYMVAELGYRHLFDDHFVSCQLGCTKPSLDYFEAVLDRCGQPADHLLFIDDNAKNVSAARKAGMHARQFDHSQGAAGMRVLLADFGIEV
jgi:putative hydrolase of the HAD superfamily